MDIAEILLVEDNPGDVGLIRKALQRSKIANTMHVVGDGEEALRFLRQEEPYAAAPRPCLVLLDLNLPKLDGREVLQAIKSDPKLLSIPVVVLTSSEAERDVLTSYQLHANSYVTKPPTLQKLQEALARIHEYWFAIVKLPAPESP